MLTTENTLLQTLNDADLQMLEPHVERIALERGQDLYEAFRPIEYVYFMESGLSSEIIRNNAGKGIEVSLFNGVPCSDAAGIVVLKYGKGRPVALKFADKVYGGIYIEQVVV